jgi:hypothetical protein
MMGSFIKTGMPVSIVRDNIVRDNTAARDVRYIPWRRNP